jgi:hypothetical protein
LTPEDLLSRLAGKLRVPALRPDAEGRVRLDFADGPAIELAIPVRGQLYAEAELDRLPARPSEAEALMRRLMARSLGTLRDRPEVLALDSAGQRLVLFRRFDIDAASFAEFEAGFTDFLDQVERWKASAAPVRPIGPASVMIFP